MKPIPVGEGFVFVNSWRPPGTDYWGPETMDGVGLSHPYNLIFSALSGKITL
ncbi:hypothetical protein [Methylicorpusculum sp.]|uniref:hypothetical protein n=1 Tax=Methylicorpusculum sp. TaxID=2713644 RepID=UPI00273172A1|nr:hypothetical protein [Methylicorpusculum sp.]